MSATNSCRCGIRSHTCVLLQNGMALSRSLKLYSDCDFQNRLNEIEIRGCSSKCGATMCVA